MLIVNGWHLLAHPLFLDQLERLASAVDRGRREGRAGANAKLLAALRRLAFELIPQDPTRPEYRQGSTLGADRKHWFRAKFGNGRFRLFFRFDTRSRIIIYAWVNDAETLRTYGAKRDAYAVFRAMLASGDPPEDWAALRAAAADPAVVERLARTVP